MIISAETAYIFMMASAVLALVPGPDNIFVLTQSALYGRVAGIFITLGLCTGILVHTAAVTFGVAVLFQTSEIAFNALKVAGAVYLLYLAWQAFRADAALLGKPKQSDMSALKLYTRGVIMNITNPKVAIFFLAFLPQFADSSQGSMTLQLFTLGGLFMMVSLVIFSVITWMAGYLGRRLQRSTKTQTTMNRVAGMVFVALALRLIVSQR